MIGHVSLSPLIKKKQIPPKMYPVFTVPFFCLCKMMSAYYSVNPEKLVTFKVKPKMRKKGVVMENFTPHPQRNKNKATRKEKRIFTAMTVKKSKK